MSFNSELIGTDRTTTIDAYCARDTEMNSSVDQVPNYLKKLAYYNIDSVTEHENFMNSILKKIVCIKHEKMTIGDIMATIKNSPDHDLFEKNLNYRITRAVQLSKHIDTQSTDYSAFYNDLTLEELVYLGY